MLCAEHEGALNEIDKYGIKFCREWVWQCALWRNGPVLEVRNPHPQRLVTFACACVWRSAARGGISPRFALGPYADRLARRIFDGDLSWSPPLLLSRLGMLDANGEGLNMAMLPHAGIYVACTSGAFRAAASCSTFNSTHVRRPYFLGWMCL